MRKVIWFFVRHSQNDGLTKHRRAGQILVITIVASIIAGVTTTLLLSLINQGLASNAAQNPALVWWFIGLCLILPITRFAAETLFNLIFLKGTENLHMRFCQRILSAPLRLLEQVGTQRIATVLIDDIKTMSDALISFIILCMHTTIVIGCLLYLAVLSWQVFLIVLASLVLGLGGYQLVAARGQAFLALGRAEFGTLLQHFTALTAGNKELKLHRQRRKAFVLDVFMPTIASFQRYVLKGNALYNAGRTWGGTVYFVLAGILVFGILPRQPMSSETVASYALVILYMLGPLEMIVSCLVVLSRAQVALDNIEKLGVTLSGDDSPVDLMAPPVAPPAWRRLDLNSVAYSYQRSGEDSLFNIGPIDLTIYQGEIVFLTGGNGSGKTTLGKLMVGLYTPESGTLALDGRPVTPETLDDYRQMFSTIFLDFFLFESLIGLDMPELDPKARSYLSTLQLDHKVQVNGGKLSTTDLSEGQRKRLALLTAYLEDRPFYVFDEWAATQDLVFKEVFYTQILPDLKRRGKTVVAITHDDTYFHVADRIIKLDYGQVVQDGFAYETVVAV
jgi:putative pyoverdin transport system ATP-binding/permease protein